MTGTLKLVASRNAPQPTVREVDWSILMARAQNGDSLAYRRLLESVTPYLRARLSRRLANSADVEDVVQDILLTVHAVRTTYDPARPFGPWIVAIAERRMIDRLRRQGRRDRFESEFDSVCETFPDAAANLDAMMETDHVAQAINRLPAGQREAVRLTKIEGLSLKEAAAESGMSIAALKVSTHRALRRLRQLLKDMAGR